MEEEEEEDKEEEQEEEVQEEEEEEEEMLIEKPTRATVSKDADAHLNVLPRILRVLLLKERNKLIIVHLWSNVRMIFCRYCRY